MINKATQNLPALIKRLSWFMRHVRMISYIPVGVVVLLFSLVMFFEPWGHHSIVGVSIRCGCVVAILGALLWGRRVMLARIMPLLQTFEMLSSFGGGGISGLMGVLSPKQPSNIEASPVDEKVLKDAVSIQDTPPQKGFSINPDEIAGAMKLVQAFSKAVQKKKE